MDFALYLPDDIGRAAKDANLPMSRILRAAVLEALNMPEPPKKQSGTKTRLDDLEQRVAALEATR